MDERLSGAEYINLEPNTTWNVALCIYHENINNEEITKLLGCEPTHAHVKGDFTGPRKINVASIGLWELSSPKELAFLDRIEYVINRTTSKKSIWDKLNETHNIQLRCSAFLHSWTDGFDITADMLRVMAERHWLFYFAFYSAEGDEIVDSFLKKDPDFEKKLKEKKGNGNSL